MNNTNTTTQIQTLLKNMLVFAVLVYSNFSAAQLTYTFTSAGATGNIGPTQAQLNGAYLATNLSGMVSSCSGIQTWTIPYTGYYVIEARGAQGGGLAPLKYGGKGTCMKGEFFFNAGTALKIVVGQQGSSISNCYGGGGGSFVSTLSNTPLIVAGGGGGAGGLGGGNGVDASIGTSGTSGVAGGAGGTNGNGGTALNTNAGSGAGFFTNGTGNFYMPECSTSVGKAFISGGDGGQFDSWEPGGFGGGGSGWDGNGNGGGGGGYSGGGTSGSSFLGGGGGGSYNSGINQVNTPSANSGDGSVIIKYIFRADIIQTSSVSCYGYSTAVLSSTITGGTPPFTYNWSPISNTNSLVTGLGAGIYTLTVTDANNLVAKSTHTITQPNGSTISAIASKTILCKGDSIVLTANGASSYTWSNNVSNAVAFTPNSSTTYCVIGTLNGCNASASVHVIVNSLPQISVSGPSLICNGTSATLTASGALTYTWLAGSSNSTITTAPITNTTLIVSGTNNHGCVGTHSFDITVSNCTGLNTATAETDQTPLKLYPNPNNGIFTIELNNEEGLLTVIDMMGKVVVHRTIQSNEKVDLSELTNGLYAIKVLTHNSINRYSSFIKQ